MRLMTQEQTRGVMWVVFGLLLLYALIICLTDFGGINLFVAICIFFTVLVNAVRISDPERLPISILSHNKFLKGTFVFLTFFVLAHGVLLVWKIIFSG